MTWRSVFDDGPDWRDAGTIELRAEDGATVVGELYADDVGFDGNDEYPVWTLTVNGAKASLYSFEDWRRL